MQASTVAAQGAVGGDHAVARDDDRDRVRAVGAADRAAGAGALAEFAGDVEIGAGLPEGDRQETVPDGELEGCADKIESNIEALAAAREVLRKFELEAGEMGAPRRAVRLRGDGGITPEVD